MDQTTELDQSEITAALFDISKSLRLLGNGNIDRGDEFPGAIERLLLEMKDAAGKIAESLGYIASSIDHLAEAIEDSK